MKKLVLVAIIAMFAFQGNSQNISFGAKAGVNFASLTGDDADDSDSRTGLHFGAVANIGLTEKFSVQPELLYSAKGASVDDSGIDGTIKLDYISIPIMADYKIASGFSVQAGPELAFTVNDKVELEEDGIDVEVEADANSFDFGLGFGAQYEMANGIFFQARYGFGLSEIFDEADVKNSVFSLSVGYFFKKK